MVYFGKKQSGGSGPLPANTATTDGNNTFTGNNTFNNAITTTGLTSSNNGDISISPNGTGRIQAQADILMNNHYIAGLATPNSAQDAANKQYVDNQITTCAKLASANTFTQTNTFNGQTNFRSRVELKNTTNNNGGFLENFDYKSKNYTALKLFKDTNTNLLQIEANNTDSTVNINSGTGNNIIKIDNLVAPTTANQAATKSYVDGIIKQKEVLLSSAQWKNNINSNKTRVYGFTNTLTTAQKDNVLGVELFVNANWNANGENSYLVTYARYSQDELKVYISRYDGQAIVDTTLDAYTIKIRYVDNITTV